MNAIITPGRLSGARARARVQVRRPPGADLRRAGGRPTRVRISALNRDIEATAGAACAALGAGIRPVGRRRAGPSTPIADAPVDAAVLDCGESGSTLRFLLPVACALGVKARSRAAGGCPSGPTRR